MAVVVYIVLGDVARAMPKFSLSRVWNNALDESTLLQIP